MEKKFKPGDEIYHKNLNLYGVFLDYAWESDDECDVAFYTEDGTEERHVSTNQLVIADKI